MRLVNASTFRGVNPALWKDVPACKCGEKKMFVINKQWEPTRTVIIKCSACGCHSPEAENILDAVKNWRMMQLIS